MSSTDISILALIKEKDNLIRYGKYIKPKIGFQETKFIFESIEQWYELNINATILDIKEFSIWFTMNKTPNIKPEKLQLYFTIIDNIEKEPISISILETLEKISTAKEIKDLSEGALNDSSLYNNNITQIKSILDKVNLSVPISTNYFINFDLDSLVQKIVKGDGIDWRLDDLNISVGQVHNSDFIVIGKRPDVGGTAFIISEFTHMVKQLPENKNAIIFNNEEDGDRIAIRVIQSALDKSMPELLLDIDKAKEEYKTYMGDKSIEIYHKNDISMEEIESILSSQKYWLIAINVLEKIKGFNNLDDVTRRQKLAEWCRKLANTYGAVFAVIQAGDSAEGVKYLNQNQLYGSRTGVQGEIDVLLMIGKSNDPGEEFNRYISICKNKKPTTGRMKPSHRYLRFQTEIDVERSRYKSV